MSETTEGEKASAARLAGLRKAINEIPIGDRVDLDDAVRSGGREKHELPEGWSPHRTGYQRQDGWVVRPYGKERWCTVTPSAVLFGGDMPRTSAAAMARVPPIVEVVEPEDPWEDMVFDDDDEGVESKVLLAEKVYSLKEDSAGEIPSWWAPVLAGDIAEHVREGWTVEAVQWSDTPGEALCVVLRRSSR